MSENIYICENCGKEFTEDYRKADNYYKKTHPIKFCSRRCTQSYLGKKSQEKHPNTKRPEGWINPLKGTSFKKVPGPPNYCQYCSREFKWKEGKALHEKSCSENPNKIPGACFGIHRTEAEKKHLSEIALANNYGQRFVDSVKSIRNYKGAILGSTYEETVARSLDENSIKWIKPKYLKWISPIDNKEHRYYPDLYLPDYDIYLDPKNDYLINSVNTYFGIKDIEKIKLVEQRNNVRILILDKNHLTWDLIKLLMEGCENGKSACLLSKSPSGHVGSAPTPSEK